MLRLSRAGLVGDAGQYAAKNVVAESRCVAEAVSQRMVCVREQLKKGGLATLSSALAKSATEARVCGPSLV